MAQLAAPGETALPGVLAGRSSFLLAYRAAARMETVVALRNRGRLRRRHIPLLAASVAADLVEWTALRRSFRAYLGPRLVAQCVNTAAWAGEIGDNYDAAVLAGVPLVAEAAVRVGPAAVLVAAADAATTLAYRRRRHQRGDGQFFFWQLLAVGAGLLLRWYESHQNAAALELFERDVQARARAAHSEGQASIALGVDTAIDMLWSLGTILGPEALGAQALRDWRDRLAAQVGKQATYLGQALLEWERRHNVSSQLALDVVMHLAPGDGTVLLSPMQERYLVDQLDRLGLVGEVEVRVVDRNRAAHPAGRRLLSVNGVPLDLPADDLPSSVKPIDPGPLAVLLGAAWLVVDMVDTYGGTPIAATLPWVAATTVIAWAMRSAGPYDPRNRSASILALIGIAAGFSATAMPGMRRPGGPFGQQRYPFLDAAIAPALLTSMYLDDLTSRQRAAIALAGAGLAAVGTSSLRHPLRPRQLLSAVIWASTAVIPARALAPSYRRRAGATAAARTAQAQARIDAAYIAGRRSVMDYARAAQTGARRAVERLERLGTLLDSDLPAIYQRLEQIEQRLAALEEPRPR